MFCQQAYDYAQELIDFIHFLYKPTLIVFGCLAVPKVVYFVFKGIL